MKERKHLGLDGFDVFSRMCAFWLVIFCWHVCSLSTSRNLQAGTLTRSRTECYTPCKNPVFVPGKCCPICRGKICPSRSSPFQPPTSPPLLSSPLDPSILNHVRNIDLFAGFHLTAKKSTAWCWLSHVQRPSGARRLTLRQTADNWLPDWQGHRGRAGQRSAPCWLRQEDPILVTLLWRLQGNITTVCFSGS